MGPGGQKFEIPTSANFFNADKKPSATGLFKLTSENNQKSVFSDGNKTSIFGNTTSVPTQPISS